MDGRGLKGPTTPLPETTVVAATVMTATIMGVAPVVDVMPVHRVVVIIPHGDLVEGERVKGGEGD